MPSGWHDFSCGNFLKSQLNVCRLRKKIEPVPDTPKYILTIWGIGYKFNDQL
nr:helix-turn-helix domain-containing protein [Enterocloster clostridioformis]